MVIERRTFGSTDAESRTRFLIYLDPTEVGVGVLSEIAVIRSELIGKNQPYK